MAPIVHSNIQEQALTVAAMQLQKHVSKDIIRIDAINAVAMLCEHMPPDKVKPQIWGNLMTGMPNFAWLILMIITSEELIDILIPPVTDSVSCVQIMLTSICLYCTKQEQADFQV